MSASGWTMPDDLADARPAVERLAAHLQLPGLDLGDVEHVVDERQQVAGAVADHLELLALLRVQRPGQPLEDDAR